MGSMIMRVQTTAVRQHFLGYFGEKERVTKDTNMFRFFLGNIRVFGRRIKVIVIWTFVKHTKKLPRKVYSPVLL